mmetsp:Transcript_116206/g.309129  ORF Transcript_116206/g.309129 Transcript_116206/m.309129 type:complete len:249 (+) Transcript_116206:161-907(+)
MRKPSWLPTSVESTALARMSLALASPRVLPDSEAMVYMSVAVSMAPEESPLASLTSAIDLNALTSRTLLPASLAFACASVAAFPAESTSPPAMDAFATVSRVLACMLASEATEDASFADATAASTSPLANCSSAVAISASASPALAPASLKKERTFPRAATASERPSSFESWMEARTYMAPAFFFLSSTLPTIWSATPNASSSSPLARWQFTTARSPPTSPSLSLAPRNMAKASITNFWASSSSFMVK